MCSSTASTSTTRHRDGTPRRRGALRKDELAQARAWADGDFDADHGFGLDRVRAARPIRAGCAVSAGWSGAAAVRATLLCINKPPPPARKKVVVPPRAVGNGTSAPAPVLPFGARLQATGAAAAAAPAPAALPAAYCLLSGVLQQVQVCCRLSPSPSP
jgi:hypothetical protein